MDQGGNYWALFTPGIWKVLHAVLQPVVSKRPDPNIARDIVTALKHELPYSFDQVKAVVKDGWVTLEGEVEWNY